MGKLEEIPVGFDVKDSPFGKLWEENTYYSLGYVAFTLATMTDGYIYLVPFRKFESITVDQKFITATNLKEAIANFWDPEMRKEIKAPQDLLDLMQRTQTSLHSFEKSSEATRYSTPVVLSEWRSPQSDCIRMSAARRE